jgi:hypothetical protein
MGGRNALFVDSAWEGQICVAKTFPKIRSGEPAWIEFDLSPYDANSVDFVDVRLLSSKEVTHWRRIVKIPRAGWQRFRFPFVFREGAKALGLEFSRHAASDGSFAVGRVKIYHAREPVNSTEVRIEEFDFSRLPISAKGLERGRIWVDVAAGNVLRRV